MSVQISKKKQIIFGIIVLVIVLGIIEAFANVWWYEINQCKFEKSEIFKDIKPEIKRQLCLDFYNLQYTDTKIFPSSGFNNINSEGFRGPEITKEKPENTYRIFLVGGSTTFGSGNDDSTTISAFLQKKFDMLQLDFDVEIINAGISGAWSEPETKMVKERLVNYKPDLIIVYDGVNDLASYLQGSENSWKDRWIEICDFGKQHDFKTIITLQPFVGTGNRILTEYEYDHYVSSSVGDWLKIYPLFIKQLSSLNNHCAKTADLTKIFDLIPGDIFWDPVHVGDRGNKIIADNFYKLILPLILDKEISFEDNSVNLDSIIQDNSDNSTILENQAFNQLISFYKTPRILLHFMDNGFANLNEPIISLANVNLKEANLQGKSFAGKDLRNVKFYEANLKDVDFSNANLVGANFAGADLSNANLENANLKGAILTNANLENANLKGAILDCSEHPICN